MGGIGALIEAGMYIAGALEAASDILFAASVLSSIGMGVYMGLNMPDMPPGSEASLQLNTVEEGTPVAEVLGTRKVGGVMFDRSELAHDGAGNVGDRFYMRWALGVCRGPVDQLEAIYLNDECVWSAGAEPDPGDPDAPAEIPIIYKGETLGRILFYFGSADQPQNDRMAALYDSTDLCPNFSGLCYAWFDEGGGDYPDILQNKGFLLGTYARAPQFSFVVTRRPAYSFNASEAIGDYDYNPAHALYHVLVDLLGLDPSMIDEYSFSAAADQFASEGLGVSPAWAKDDSGADLVESLLAHMGAGIVKTEAGLVGLQALRKDYPAAPSIEITDAQIVGEITLDRPSWLGTSNRLRAKYPRRFTNDAGDGELEFKDAVFCVQDPGNRRTQEGRAAEKTISLPYFTDEDNVKWAAERALKAASYPLARISFEVLRDAVELQPADLFYFTYEPYNMTRKVFRLVKVTEGTLEEGETIRLEAIEAVEYLGDSSLARPTSLAGKEDWSLEALDAVEVLELPWRLAGEKVAVTVLSAKKKPKEQRHIVYAAASETGEYRRLGEHLPNCNLGTLVAAYPYGRTIDPVGFQVDLAAVTGDQHLRDGNVTWDEVLSNKVNLAVLSDGTQHEIIQFRRAEPDESVANRWRIYDVLRRRFDTAPLDFETGDRVWFGVFDNAYTKSSGRVQDVPSSYLSQIFGISSIPYFKVVPANVVRAGSLAGASAVNITGFDRVDGRITHRALRPYSPVNFRVAGGSYTYATYSTDVAMTWNPRRRGRGAGSSSTKHVLAGAPYKGQFLLRIVGAQAPLYNIRGYAYKVVDDTEYTLTAAEQTTIFGSPRDRLWLTLFNLPEGGDIDPSDWDEDKGEAALAGAYPISPSTQTIMVDKV